MKREDIQKHINEIDLLLSKNPDMQFTVELLKAKSTAMIAYALHRESIKVYMGNADDKRFYLGGCGS